MLNCESLTLVKDQRIVKIDAYADGTTLTDMVITLNDGNVTDIGKGIA